MLAAPMILSGCQQYQEVNETVTSNKRSVDEALQKVTPTNKISQTLTIDDRPWFGSRAVPMTNGQPLPVQFQQSDSLVLTFPGPVDLRSLARIIEGATNMRTSVGNVIATGGTGGGVAAAAGLGGEEGPVEGFVPAGADPVSGGRYVWQGRLSDLLNQASDYFNADWTYDGTMVRFNQTVTRTFMLHALAVNLDANSSIESGGSESGGSGGGSGGDSGGSTGGDISIDSSASIKIWDEMQQSVSTLLGDNGKAAFSPSTGAITVTGTPEGVRRVEDYLNQQNAMRLRRVLVAVKVLSVVIRNELDLGVESTGVLNNMLKGVFPDLQLQTGGADGVAIGTTDYVVTDPVSGDLVRVGEDSLLSSITASELVERASIVHSGSIVTLSDMPAPLQVGRQITYLARTSSSASDGSSSVSLEPGTVDVGLMMTVLPRIVDTNKILMRASISITDAQTPFRSFGPTGNQIEVPEVETTGFMQNSVLTSGETLVLAGFEKNTDANTDDGVPGLSLLGGTRSSDRAREVTVLMITGQILPEEPMTTIGE